MTKDDFAERCAEAAHVWEAFEQHLHPDVFACEKLSDLCPPRWRGHDDDHVRRAGMFQPRRTLYEAGSAMGLRRSLHRRLHFVRIARHVIMAASPNASVTTMKTAAAVSDIRRACQFRVYRNSPGGAWTPASGGWTEANSGCKHFQTGLNLRTPRCAKTRRRSIAIEEIVRPRPLWSPDLQANST